MAKILVADDNSNIQKMVGLALKDQGIDVVAVGNGEAAVRKIADVRPDLVLADVFMPVRNGYEVCKYVKGDSSLAHIPVILLVGAFDPLDEEEAQRVGADGVLKKPFVPPDPLISMVKSALVRASTGNVNMPKPSNDDKSSATVTSVPNVPTSAAIPTGVLAQPDAAAGIPARPAELKIEPGTQAFGNLLETAPAETGDETAFVAPNPVLLERDWSATQEEEEEEEEDSTASWRLAAGTEAFADEAQTPAKKPEKKKREAWTPTREKTQDLLESATEPQFVSEPVSAKPVATKPSVPVPPSAPAVAPPTQAPVTPPVPVAAKPPVAAPTTPARAPKPWVEMPPEKPAQPVPTPVQVAEKAPAKQPAAPPKEAAPKEGTKAPEGGSWFSISSTPWEADAKQPGQTAPAWDAPAAPSAPAAKAPVQPSASASTPALPEIGIPEQSELEPEPEPTGFYTDPTTLPELVSGGENISPEAVEALRHEATQVVEESTLQRVVESSSEYTLNTPEGTAPEAAPDMEALVAKVLSKLSPEVLQAVTREILKPVVEAMVRDEIKAKKS